MPERTGMRRHVSLAFAPADPHAGIEALGVSPFDSAPTQAPAPPMPAPRRPAPPVSELIESWRRASSIGMRPEIIGCMDLCSGCMPAIAEAAAALAAFLADVSISLGSGSGAGAIMLKPLRSRSRMDPA